MVSYTDLIYHFTDIYLSTAMECAICKENYTFPDDTEFLDEYMKFFISLLLSVEQNDSLELATLIGTLEQKKQKKLLEFQSFLKQKTMEAALESIKVTDSSNGSLQDIKTYMAKLEKFYDAIFDEGSEAVKDKPTELLRYMRSKEESIYNP